MQELIQKYSRTAGTSGGESPLLCQDSDGWTPLMWATSRGAASIVRMVHDSVERKRAPGVGRVSLVWIAEIAEAWRVYGPAHRAIVHMACNATASTEAGTPGLQGAARLGNLTYEMAQHLSDTQCLWPLQLLQKAET